LQNHNSQICQN